MPIHHTTLLVSDLAAAKTFYNAALAPLKYALAMEFPEQVGYGTPGGKVDFWLKTTEGVKVPSIHLAFTAKSEEEVKAVYEAALKAGGVDNGAPGPRPQYSPNYYGAFFRDLDGNNMEAVLFKPQ